MIPTDMHGAAQRLPRLFCSSCHPIGTGEALALKTSRSRRRLKTNAKTRYESQIQASLAWIYGIHFCQTRRRGDAPPSPSVVVDTTADREEGLHQPNERRAAAQRSQQGRPAIEAISECRPSSISKRRCGAVRYERANFSPKSELSSFRFTPAPNGF